MTLGRTAAAKWSPRPDPDLRSGTPQTRPANLETQAGGVEVPQTGTIWNAKKGQPKWNLDPAELPPKAHGRFRGKGNARHSGHRQGGREALDKDEGLMPNTTFTFAVKGRREVDERSTVEGSFLGHERGQLGQAT